MTPISRPRVEGAREDEILDAALDLLLETGYDRLTMDAVAKRARASKATLYRRWESKPALMLDVMVRAKGAPQVEAPDTGTLRGDLLAAYCGPHGPVAQTGAAVMGAVVTAVSTDPEFAEVFRERFIAPKLAVSHEIYARAVERGEIPADIDLDVIGPAMAGILLHRTFVMGLPVTDECVERVIDHVILPAVGNRPPARKPKSTTPAKRMSTARAKQPRAKQPTTKQ